MRQKPCFSGRAFNLVSANFNSVPLVVEYHRPESVAEAVELLQQPDHVALAGGTVVNADRNRSQLVAVDLQSLGLDVVSREASRVQFGAMCRLSDVERQCSGDLLAEAARRELPSTLRTVGTVGGTVAAGGGESLMLAALMASGASVRTANGDEVSVEHYVSAPRELIVGVDVTAEGAWTIEHTGRTPMDTPIVAVVGRRSEDGITLALTGVGAQPVVARSIDDINQLIPIDDFRGSSEYRHHLAVTLGERVLGDLS